MNRKNNIQNMIGYKKALGMSRFCISAVVILSVVILFTKVFTRESISIDHYAPNCPTPSISASVTSIIKINDTASCGPPSAAVISPTQIDIRFPNYNCGGCLCREVYPVTFVAGDGWKITKCYTGTCVTTVLHTSYEGTFWTGPLEDTDESAGDGNPDYNVQITTAEVPAAACCGNEILEIPSGEECDNVSGFVYTDIESDCPYGEGNCCYTHENSTESLRCTLYGPRCGDGVGDPFNNANIDSGYEECDGGDGVNGTECIPGEPGTCRYCKSDCTIGRVTNGADIPLVVTGGLVALGDESGNSAIELNRNLIFYSPIGDELYSGDNGANVFNDNMSPSEAIFYDPRYLDIYRNILGSFGNIQFRESGVQ